ncbi:MAG: N-acetylneuraminate synthase family protein [Peptostreptococcaceae bacterium]|nr:N-acetylneuraminate synthase family protein [Peptostreptococcaceae bacterium]
MREIKIGGKYIGEMHHPYFVADIAANHDGSIERAFKLIELAKEAGADAAKFQNFKAERIVSDFGFNSMGSLVSHQINWGKSVFDVYKEASISYEWTARLQRKCQEVGIEYMTSPYDFETIDSVDPYVNCYKIGSGDITWTDILEHISKKKKPVILATGASDLSDVDRAVKAIYKWNNNLVLMQCNTNYTASNESFEYINLNVLKLYGNRYPDTILGLSDHTYGHAAVLGAIALGARVIEKHFTDDNDRKGPDHKFSMTPITWKNMMQSSNELFLALGDGIKRVEKNEEETAKVQRRALYFTCDFPAGHILEEADLFPLRPILLDNIEPYRIEELIGRNLKRAVHANEPIKNGDVI